MSSVIVLKGNLGRVDFITENEYDLFVRPDTCNPRARFWFHFSVENVQRGQRVLFNVVNLGRTRYDGVICRMDILINFPSLIFLHWNEIADCNNSAIQ